jgi:uncharacterized repeat protein (TIGR01451 family)
LIGSAVRPEVVSDGNHFFAGSSTNPGLSSRQIDFVCDEVHHSSVARSQGYLESNSVLRVATSQGAYGDGGTWDIGDLGVGASVSLVITARVESARVVTNLAEIIAVDQGDPDPDNNSGVVVTGPRADLGVTKTVDNASPSAGDTIVYTVTVNNNGPGTATGIQVEDALPAGVSAFQLADSDTLVHWHFSEPAAPPDFPDTVDSGPLGLDGWIYNDGIDRSPKTVTLDAGGLAGSGIEFQGFANDGSSASRATVVFFDLPTGEFPGGDFTAELWATGISDSELDSRADGTFGMYLIGQGRLGEDWALSLEFDGRFQLRFNRAGSGGGEQVVTFGNAGVDWDNDTWYYIALVADTNGQAAGMAEYTVYRRTGTAESGFEIIGTAVRPAVVSDGESFFAGTSPSPGAVARVLDFTCDEVHYSKAARSQSYLESNSVLRVGVSQGAYGTGGVWDVGSLGAGASATLVITARVETVASAITNVAEIIAADAVDDNPGNDSDSAVIGGPPALPDTDGDGIPDFWELLHFGGITNAVAGDDTDMDRADNLAEYTADTIPTNAASVFVITDLTVSNPAVISFDSSAGRVYTLQSATDLVSGNWSNEPGQVDRTGVGGPDAFTNDATIVEKDYRIGVRVP